LPCGFGRRVYQFVTGKSSVTGNLIEAYSYTGRKEVGEVPKISERLLLKKVKAVERWAKADWESVRKRADCKWHVFR